jgi:hypothetical protein
MPFTIFLFLSVLLGFNRSCFYLALNTKAFCYITNETNIDPRSALLKGTRIPFYRFKEDLVASAKTSLNKGKSKCATTPRRNRSLYRGRANRNLLQVIIVGVAGAFDPKTTSYVSDYI